MSSASSNQSGDIALFDVHCHLQSPRLAPDLPAVLDRARGAGVTGMICCATAERDWQAVLDIADRHEGVRPALGLHPWYLRDRSPDWLKRLEKSLATATGATVGEIGIDHVRPEGCLDEQESVFLAQLRLAAALERPVNLHCRGAWERLIQLLENEPRLPPALVLHSYSGSAETVARLEGAGCFFSFSGSLTRPGNRRGPRACAAVPARKLLLETDAPDLLPSMPDAPRERPNEPAFLPLVLAAAAAARGEVPATTAALAVANAHSIYPGGHDARSP